MATVITEECINCGACEPECPNIAIYAGGVAYELFGATHAALSNDFFYIVPEKCSECVGFLDHEACAAACPVDCCVADPKRPEPEDVLLARARTMHPDRAFEEPPPSRFRNARPTSAVAVTASLAPKAPAQPDPPPTAAPTVAAAEATAPAKEATAATATTPKAVAPAAAPKAAAADEAAPARAAQPATVTAQKSATTSGTATAAAGVATAKPAAAAAVVAPAAPAAAPIGAADPAAELEVPVLCRNCQREYALAFSSLSPGANLRCPHCRASHSPTQEHFLLVGERLRRYLRQRGAAPKDADKLRQSLDRDLRAIAARLLSRPKSSWLGLS